MRTTQAMLLLCLALSASAANDAELIARVRNSKTLIADTRELTDRIGGRLTGSPACARAEAWAVAKLREAGVDSVKLEPYTLPNHWRSKVAEGRALAPEAFVLRVAAAPMSASTPDGAPIEAALVDFGEGTAESLAKVPPSKGKIAFVHTAIMKSLDDLFGDYLRILPILDAAKKSGVSAILLESSQPRTLLYRHPMDINDRIVPIPVAVVAHDQAERLVRLMQSGPVRVRLRLENEVTKNVTAHNVIGEIRGTDKADEIVLFGAHLDSFDLGTGALDNGVNSATVIDLARQIVASGLHPRRTLRFVLFTGEEQGMIGSKAYARAHAAEMPRLAMMITCDIGSGKTTGFFLNGREELGPEVVTALTPLLDPKSQANPPDGIDGTDNFDFLLYGVPNLVGNQDPAPYLPEYHAESDTFDKVDQAQAVENAAMVAAALWHFANADRRAPQQTRAEVEKLLVATHVDDQMKAFDQWDDWAAGRRGLGK